MRYLLLDEGALGREACREALYRLGESARRAGFLDFAFPPLAEAADLDPTAPEPLAALAKLYEAAGDWENVVKTVDAFNDAVNDAPFDPSKHDGKCAQGISPVKSNWAQRLDTPPYYAFPVTCGITFTFGGIGITEKGEVKTTRQQAVSPPQLASPFNRHLAGVPSPTARS